MVQFMQLSSDNRAALELMTRPTSWPHRKGVQAKSLGGVLASQPPESRVSA